MVVVVVSSVLSISTSATTVGSVSFAFAVGRVGRTGERCCGGLSIVESYCWGRAHSTLRGEIASWLLLI